MRRRTLFILIIVVVIVIVIGAAYLLSTRNQSGTASSGTTGSLPTVNTQGGSAGTTAGTGTGAAGGSAGTGSVGTFTPGNTGTANSAAPRFGLVFNEPVLAYYVDAQNNVVLIEPDGKIATIVSGNASFLNSTEIQGVLSASFSHDGGEILVNFGDPTNPQTSIFDVSTKSWTPLQAGILSPVWSPIDDRIAYLSTNNRDGSETLYTLNASNSKAKPVALTTLHLQDIYLMWPNKDEIVIAERPSSYETTSLFVFSIAKGTFSQPISDAAGLDTIWSNSTSSNALVFEAGAAERGGTLSLFNPADGGLQSLVFLTLPSKCVFNNETATSSSSASAAAGATSTANVAAPTSYLAFYCAVPQDPSTLTYQALPDAYYQKALFTVDSLYRVRADTGEMKTLFTPPIAVDATSLKVFNNILFFINRYDQKLYALSLGD